MDVAVTELRAHLSTWLARAREGQEIVVTDRGLPIARLSGLGSTPILDRLTAEGVISVPSAPRPVLSGRPRPRSRRPVADRVTDDRR